MTAVPRPSAADAAALHDSADYFAKKYFEGRRGRHAAAEARFGRLRGRLERRLPATQLRGRRMLDIGCDTGELLAAAKRLAGVEAYGVDVAQRPLEAARAAGVTTHHGDVATAPPSFTDFALVTAVDVIEHVADPVAFLTEARSRLASGGAIYVETPNWHSTVYALGRLLTRAPGISRSGALERLFPPEHVQYFTAQGLRIAAQRAGLVPVDVSTRVLPADALAGNIALKVAVSALQLPDQPFGRELLLCAILVPAEQT